jgi:hypothetical protein
LVGGGNGDQCRRAFVPPGLDNGDLLPGEPPPGVDWGWVEEMARKEIPAAKTYKLSWGCPRWLGERKKPGIRPDAPSPSRPGGIRSGKLSRLRKRRPDSRASRSPAAWGLTPNGVRKGKTGFAPEFAFSGRFPPPYPAPARRKTGVTTSLDTPAQNGHVRGLPNPLGGDFEQALKLCAGETALKTRHYSF